MTTLIKKITLLLVSGLSCLLLQAQPKLTVDSAWTLPMDSVTYNGSAYIVVYNVVIENIGNAKLDGPVEILMRYNEDSIEHRKVLFNVIDFEVGMQYQVGFNDTITDLTGNRYKGGDNILVIWPKADNVNVQAPDTAHVPLHIKDIRSSTKDQSALLHSRVTVYPNPASDVLNLLYLRDQNKLEYVRILSIDGKELFQSTQPVQEIPLNTLPAGTFMLELKYSDGLRGTFKLVHY